MNPPIDTVFDWTLLAIAAPFAAAFIARFSGRTPVAAAWFLVLVPAATFAHFLLLLPTIASGLVVYGGVDWLSSSGVPLTYALDGLSLLFVLLANLVGVFALIDHALSTDRRKPGRSLSSIFLLIGSMQGLVLADGLIALVIACIFASLASAWMVLVDRDAGARRGAAPAMLAVTMTGSALLLWACLLLIRDSSFYDDGAIASLTAAINAAWQLRETGLYRPVFAFGFAGVVAFAAQAPVFLWWRGPARTPAQVQACFFGVAALVPAYLLMRFHPFLGDTPLWSLSVPVLGAIMLIGAAVSALRAADYEYRVGWLAAASLGLMILMIGTSLNRSLFAAVAMVLAHALAVPALVLITAAGRGVGPASWPRTVPGLLAGLSLCGAPLTIGYVARGSFQEAMIDAAFPDLLGDPAPLAWLLQLYTLAVLAVSVLGGVMMVMIALRIWMYPRGSAAEPSGSGRSARYAVPAAYALAGVAAGLGSDRIAALLLNPARYSVNLVPYDITPPAHAAPDAAFGLTVLIFFAGALMVRFALRSRRPAQDGREVE